MVWVSEVDSLTLRIPGLSSEIDSLSLRTPCLRLRKAWFESQNYLVWASAAPGLSLINILFEPQKPMFWVSEIPCLGSEVGCLTLRIHGLSSEIDSLSLRCSMFESQQCLIWVSAMPDLSLRSTWFESQKYLVWASEICGWVSEHLVWASKLHGLGLRNTQHGLSLRIILDSQEYMVCILVLNILNLRTTWFESQIYLVWISELRGLSLRNTWHLSFGNTWFESQTRPCLSPWGTCLEFQKHLFESQKYMPASQNYIVWALEIPSLSLRQGLVWVPEVPAWSFRNTFLSLRNTWVESQTSQVSISGIYGLRFESQKCIVWTSGSHSLSLINPWFEIHGLRILYPQGVRNSQILSYLSWCFSRACIVWPCECFVLCPKTSISIFPERTRSV